MRLQLNRGGRGRGRGKEEGKNIRPCPPTKKMASYSPAWPRIEESLTVFFHSDSSFLRKETETESSLEASTEEGSRGAAPPAGEATVIETWGERTS